MLSDNEFWERVKQLEQTTISTLVRNKPMNISKVDENHVTISGRVTRIPFFGTWGLYTNYHKLYRDGKIKPGVNNTSAYSATMAIISSAVSNEVTKEGTGLMLRATISTGKYTMEQFEKQKRREEEAKNNKKDKRKQIRAEYEWLTNVLLVEDLKLRTNNYRWYIEKHLEGLGGNQHVDVVAEPTSGGRHVYLEIEGGQSRPISNVAKIWRHVAERKLKEPILLIQIFSPYYAKSEGSHNTRMEESIFIGQRAEKATPNIIYRYFRPDDWPPSAENLNILTEKISAFMEGNPYFSK